MILSSYFEVFNLSICDLGCYTLILKHISYDPRQPGTLQPSLLQGHHDDVDTWPFDQQKTEFNRETACD